MQRGPGRGAPQPPVRSSLPSSTTSHLPEILPTSPHAEVTPGPVTPHEHQPRGAQRRLSWSDVCPITSFLCPISGRLLHDPVVRRGSVVAIG